MAAGKGIDILITFNGGFWRRIYTIRSRWDEMNPGQIRLVFFLQAGDGKHPGAQLSSMLPVGSEIYFFSS